MRATARRNSAGRNSEGWPARRSSVHVPRRHRSAVAAERVPQIDETGRLVPVRGAVEARSRPARSSGIDLVLDLPADVQAERKSVVEGKSGSVRVDIGGRRIIKK